MSTLNHPLVIILLGNSNNQSCVMYISLCRHPIQISTVQSEEQHVVNHLPKFHLNWTVNEMGNAVLKKLRELQKLWCLAPKIRKVAPGGTILLPGGSCFAKNMKNNVFPESDHHTSLVWCLTAKWVPPSGSCCSRNPEISSTPANLIPTPTILIPFDFRLHTDNSSV